MSSLTVLLPIQFQRQESVPIDVDMTFNTTESRNSYLTNPRRYAGQIVSDREEEKVYLLNTAKTAWVPIGGTEIDLVYSSLKTYNTGSLVVLEIGPGIYGLFVAKEDSIIDVLPSSSQDKWYQINTTGVQEKINEELIGNLDGVNTIFELPFPYIPTTTRIYRNGVRQKLEIDYIEVLPLSVEFLVPPKTTTQLIADYTRS